MRETIDFIFADDKFNPYVPYEMSKSRAFTLAEVLITLGIIGVVAAMTIPTLISNTNSQRYKAQYKKTLSTLNQAARMAQAQYDVNFSDADHLVAVNSSASSSSYDSKSRSYIFENTLTGYTLLDQRDTESIYSKINMDFSSSNIYIYYQLADGSLVATTYDIACTSSIKEETKEDLAIACTGFIDVNGTSQPNKLITCKNGKYKKFWESGYANSTCEIDNKSMGDIFPFVYYDGTVEPATNAARAVLYSTK